MTCCLWARNGDMVGSFHLDSGTPLPDTVVWKGTTFVRYPMGPGDTTKDYFEASSYLLLDSDVF